jgi:putative IMPACT (imprinted ancient) family translation regulator
MDYYHSIEKLEEIEIKIKSSRFIAYTTPVSDRENANQVVQQIQKKHYKANHNCYAYLIG